MKKLIKVFVYVLFILMVDKAWASYPNYTVCPSGCNFSTVQGAVNDLATSHATPASPVTITISGAWVSPDTTNVNITGITTTGTNTLTIQTTGLAVNGGHLPNGSTNQGYLLKPSTGDGISVNAPYVTINGLAFDMTTSGGNGITLTDYNQNQTYINNYFKLTTGAGAYGVQFRGTNYEYNNVCNGTGPGQYNFCVGVDGGGDSSTIVYIYNNTAYNMGRDFSTDTNATPGVKIYFSNNASSGSQNGSINRPDRIFAGANNICDDSSSCTTSPLTGGTNNATSYTSYYTSPSTGDFSVLAGSILITSGTNLSAVFTTDITGTIRQSSGAWDIGSFKFTAVISTSYVSGGTLNGSNNW